jgi:hypothetical protein
VEIKLQHLIHVVGRNLICRNLIVQNFFFFRKQWIHGQESSPTTMRFMFLYMKQRQQPDEAKQRATHTGNGSRASILETEQIKKGGAKTVEVISWVLWIYVEAAREVGQQEAITRIS